MKLKIVKKMTGDRRQEKEIIHMQSSYCEPRATTPDLDAHFILFLIYVIFLI